jgi:predicted nucleic acid-binding protein
VIVLDASVVVELLLWTEAGQRIGPRVMDPEQTRHAPHLLDVEVAQVIRRYWLAGQLNARRAHQMVEDLADLPIERYGHNILLPRIWDLRDTLTAYDAAYVALSEILRATLLTRDAGLAAAIRGFSAVELL